MGGLRVKGVALVSSVDVLLADRTRFEPHVPEHLLKYLDDPPYAGDWYDAADLLGLCEAIRLGLYPELDRQLAFEQMGAATVHRDVFDNRKFLLPREQGGGMYRGALSKDLDVRTYLRRALSIWQLYYESGEQIGERAGERTVDVRIVGAELVGEEQCWMTTGYLRGVVGVLGDDHAAEHLRCLKRGADACVWRIQFGESLDPAALDVFGPTA